MTTFRIFLSAVTSELGACRRDVAQALRSATIEVRDREHFTQGGGTLLEKLRDYIEHCDAVLFLVGERAGMFPSELHQAALGRIAAFDAYAADTGQTLASYTQWEYFIAKHYDKKRYVFLAADGFRADGPIEPQTNKPEPSQQAFRRWLDKVGEDYDTFSSSSVLVRQVFESQVARLVQSVRSADEKVAEFRQRAMRPPARSLDAWVAFSANRDEQAVSFHDTVRDAKGGSAAVQPLIFAGPKEEMPEELRRRCIREAKRHFGGEPCDKQRLSWPGDKDFRSAYLKQLSMHFKSHSGAPRQEIAQALKSLCKLTVFHSIILASEWSDLEPDKIRAWLQEWSALNMEAGGGLRVIPVLCLEFGRQPYESKRIWSAVKQMCETVNKEGLKAVAPPVLNSLSLKHAQDWLAGVQDRMHDEESRFAKRLENSVLALFEGRTRRWLPWKDEPRVTMKRFAETVSSLLDETAVAR